ncbi:MAG TPA: tRNA (N6-threonylcarbamoyladenosine(37)-N6)-methyltransferase TrmO [Planctomycetota bacterium]|nr:tRNA (N6-threonylcarbamoyladenosine(37)-N6)-methyltransferase TrmO [Planctomycetota bacterium]
MGAWTLGTAALCLVLAGIGVAGEKGETVFKLFPIGTVERAEGKTYLVVQEKFAPGLLGLDGFSHVVVLYWFDKNDTPEKRSILQVHPRGNAANPLTGVFACRAPVRPNLVALSVARIVAVERNRVQVADIDAFDHTPILDLKPFIPADNPTQGVRLPDWATKGKGEK